jgi:glycosyltransferase involved in cell wall biosynthesis
MTRRVVHWICDAPSPYNSFLFRTLASRLDAELMVHFIRPAMATHPWQTSLLDGFSWKLLDRRRLADWRFVRLAATSRGPVFVVGAWYELTTQLVMSLTRAPFFVWSDTPNLTVRRPALKSALRSGWLRWVFNRASYVLGTGRPGVEAFARMGCPPEKLVNFPFYLDLELFRPGPLADRDSLVFLSSGRLHPDKGFDVALRALALASRATGASFRYRIAGTGPAQSDLERLTSELGIRDRVEFLGWVDSAALPSFYRSGNVLLHPARVDPFPVSVLEAMASGLPVLASTVSGSAADRVTAGVSGFLHEAEDATTLAGHIQNFLNTPSLAVQMGSRARSTAEQWPVDRAVADLNRLLASV